MSHPLGHETRYVVIHLVIYLLYFFNRLNLVKDSEAVVQRSSRKKAVLEILEATVRRCFVKKVFCKKFSNIHRKTPVPESLF